ncbi:MAG: hypothetical protein WA160_05145 [Pseudobdellovibrio sp.]
MKKYFLFLLLLVGCSKFTENKLITPSKSIVGTRDFKVNTFQVAFTISLFGVFMGTPDYDTVWSIINDADKNNWLTALVKLGQPIEGGLYFCIEVVDRKKRELLIDQLMQTSTSLKESNYKIQSVSSCTTKPVG